MKCPWKNNSGCANKCLMSIGLFALSVLGIAILIKIIALILYIFSGNMYLNTAISIVSTIIVLVMYWKCCGHTDKNNCCDITQSKDTTEEKLDKE